MRPYYGPTDGITIYHGDCRDVLPLVCPDAIVTDPPFGTGWVRGGGAVGEFDLDKSERPAWDRFSIEWLDFLTVRFWAVFCPNTQLHAMDGIATARVNWHKTNARPQSPALEAVFLWPVFLPDGIEWVGYNGDTPHHPCQKPEELMGWLLRFCNPHWLVCDPFMGSGTTLVAAKRMGRRAIGIEQEERYCEIAASRLAQGALFGEAQSLQASTK